ncbi:MAG: DUF3783 domain-containing protein [Ruminococcus sp.]|nr:DUF3783 domain-containing protein [Ruminococcus sp.]
MKSRIIPTIPETILSYNIGEKAEKLEEAASSLNMKHVPIPENKAGETVGFLAGYSGFTSNGTEISAEGECIIFSGITSKHLDQLLKAMRDRELDIPLKAVVTQHNQSQSIEWLLGELSKERAAIEKGRKNK